MADDDAPCGPALPPGFRREPTKAPELATLKTPAGPEVSNEEEIQIEEDATPVPKVSHQPPAPSASRTATASSAPKRRYGPALDALTTSATTDTGSATESAAVGPIVGPLPPHLVANRGKTEEDDEAEDWDRLRNPSAPKDEKQGREDWMLTLPPERNPLALTGPRKFDRTGNSSLNRGDTSAWTDTPEDKRRKLDSRNKGVEPLETEKDVLEKRRNAEMSQLIGVYNQQRQAKSLVEEHRQQMQSTGPAQSAPRPFDREKDLGMRRPIVGKEKEKLLTEAKKLNTNFSSGSYL